jgi:hypothetical protein
MTNAARTAAIKKQVFIMLYSPARLIEQPNAFAFVRSTDLPARVESNAAFKKVSLMALPLRSLSIAP